MNCPNCGGTVPPGANRCTKCGSYIEQPAAAPPAGQQAGAAQSPQVVVIQQQPQAPAMPEKSKVAAGLLGIFLGGFGVHRFYLGYGGIGAAILVLQILGWLTACFMIGFVLMAIAGVWGLIEGILILAGVINKDALGRPLT